MLTLDGATLPLRPDLSFSHRITLAYADARPEDRSLGRNVVRTRADDVIGCGDVVPLRCPFVRTRCALVPLR
ncbi:MAG: hypothetical protein ACREXX_06500 [Gammaproteobacteria bacterium]